MCGWRQGWPLWHPSPWTAPRWQSVGSRACSQQAFRRAPPAHYRLTKALVQPPGDLCPEVPTCKWLCAFQHLGFQGSAQQMPRGSRQQRDGEGRWQAMGCHRKGRNRLGLSDLPLIPELRAAGMVPSWKMPLLSKKKPASHQRPHIANDGKEVWRGKCYRQRTKETH